MPEPEQEDREAELRRLETALERSNFTRSVLVKSPRAYGHPREARLSRREHYKSVSEQVHLERIRQKTNAQPADWRKVLGMMAQETPEQSLEWIEDGLKLEIPKEILVGILDHVGDDKIGSIRRRTGAALKVSRRESTVLVSGTRQAINMATEEFRKVAGKITVTRLFNLRGPGEANTEDFDDYQSFFTPPLSREENAYAQRRRIKHHVYATSIPPTWTPESVENYVVALVDSVVDRSLHAPIYKPTQGPILLDHQGAVAKRLVWLFHDVSARKVASRSSFMLALAYLCEKGNKYLPEAREIFVLMDRRGLAFDPDVFNILLRAAVKTRDLHRFQQIIRRMTSRGLAPNLDTWILFLRMFESVDVRQYVLQTMHVKKLLSTTEAIEHVAREMATLDTEHAMRQCKTLPKFLGEQEERYGPSWLTRDAGNQVLHVLGTHGRFDDAFALLDKMGEVHARIPASRIQDRLAVRPDAASFNMIIARARVRGKLPIAINVLRKMKTRHLARQPDAYTLHLLFEMAWKFHMRTSIVVLWRYACLARLTSFRMRSRVSVLLDDAGALERIANTGEHTNSGHLTEMAYRKLGGEALARELAGGREALERLRACTQQLWGDHPPPQKIAAVAAKAVALAFGEEFGPSVALGRVLAQAALVDMRCIRARKAGALRDLLAGAKVKTMVLWRRRENEVEWVDLAPVEMADGAERIGPADDWVDEWQSEGWDGPEREPELKPEGSGGVEAAGREARDGSGGSDGTKEPTRNICAKNLNGQADGQPVADGQAIAQGVGAKPTREPTPAPAMKKRLAIINPHVWAEEDLGDDVPVLAEDGNRTQVQRQDEEAILAALEELRTNYVGAWNTAGGAGEDRGPDDIVHAKKHMEDAMAAGTAHGESRWDEGGEMREP